MYQRSRTEKISDTRILDDTPENLGMINVVKHMLNVERIEE